jgi:hypothetical protein
MRKFVCLLCLVFFLSGCVTFSPSKEVFKEKATYNSKEFSVSSDLLYQAIIKVIYSQNFSIENEDKEKGFILAKRYFQKGKRNIILVLQAKIISDKEDKSNLYLNALQITERLFVADRTRFFLWLIPLPGGGGKEASKIKEEEKIIEDQEFYQRFFEKIKEGIKTLKEIKEIQDKT